ncbi:YveK family protein [uncultured Anaerococcus sp.]|uniref:YveK family protein n=1 Tax=uncultured Anaerococcus sp. TaxID=293428 RepID=UPI0025DA3E26|nr:hypothetical protein [uncultured Anaerococcus sp.]
MKKVTTYQLIDGIKKNLPLVLLPGLILFALVLGLGLKKTGGTYEAQTVLIATAGEDEEVSYNKLILNEKLANIYSEIIKSPDLYEKVATDLNKGGGEIDYKEIMERSDYEVNPQAGLITLSYIDKNEARAEDGLTLISENFRTMARDYLNADNLNYLQDVLVEKPSKKKLVIFSLLAGVAGVLLGLIIVIIKTLFSDSLAGANDLREYGYNILGESTETLKIKSKIDYRLENGIIGLTSLGETDSFNFAKNLAEDLATNNGILFVDSKNKAGLEGKYLSELGNTKVLRKGNIDYLALPDSASEKILDSNEFFADIVNRENSYNYIMVDQKSLETSDPYLIAKLCDMEIILVDEKTKKSDLDRAILELRELGIGYCGVVYHK